MNELRLGRMIIERIIQVELEFDWVSQRRASP